RLCVQFTTCLSSTSLVQRPWITHSFPCTTLFRSGPREIDCLRLVALAGVGVARMQDDQTRFVGVRDVGAVLRADVDSGEVTGLGDRKSTRLNSSHVKISYAVFCLNKKKFADQFRT